MAHHLILPQPWGKRGAGRWRPAACTLGLSLLALLLVAWTPPATRAAQLAESTTYAVIVTGLGGESAYDKMIQGWGKDLYSALKKNGVSENHLFWLAPQKQEGVHAESRRGEIGKLLADLAGRARPQDVFFLFLIGHGSYDDYDYRFSIPGPDLTASQWGELLDRIRTERQVVVNMTSASGASLALFRRKGRVVITSTSAGRERNFSVFARYFVEALQDPASDTDKNQEVSVLEAYRYASREVARYYESLKRIATEHALLEDRGEGEGAREATPETGEGLLASSIILLHRDQQRATVDSPELRELRARKRKLEEAIEQLKYRKASMDTQEYQQEIEKLLIELSETQQRLDDLGKK